MQQERQLKRRKVRAWTEAAKLVLEMFPKTPMTHKEIFSVIRSQGLKDISSSASLACLNAMLHSHSRGPEAVFYRVVGAKSKFGLTSDIPECATRIEVEESESQLANDGDSDEEMPGQQKWKDKVLYVRFPAGYKAPTCPVVNLEANLLTNRGHHYQLSHSQSYSGTDNTSTIERWNGFNSSTSSAADDRRGAGSLTLHLSVPSDGGLASVNKVSHSHHQRAIKQALRQQQKRRRRNTSMASNVGGSPVTPITRSVMKPMSPPDIQLGSPSSSDARVAYFGKPICLRRLKPRKRNHRKLSTAAQIAQTKEGCIDLETPDSILVHTDPRALLNMHTFLSLPTTYQHRLAQLLPPVDRTVKDGNVCLSGSALSNEFFNCACQEWWARLGKGEFAPETQQRLKQETDRERAKMDPWKLKHFEPIWSQKLLACVEEVDVTDIPIPIHRPSREGRSGLRSSSRESIVLRRAQRLGGIPSSSRTHELEKLATETSKKPRLEDRSSITLPPVSSTSQNTQQLSTASQDCSSASQTHPLKPPSVPVNSQTSVNSQSPLVPSVNLPSATKNVLKNHTSLYKQIELLKSEGSQVNSKTPPPKILTPPPKSPSPLPKSQTPPPKPQTPPAKPQTPTPKSQTPTPKSQTPPPKSQTPPPKSQTPHLESQTPPLDSQIALESQTSSQESEGPPLESKIPPLKSHTSPVKSQTPPLKSETPPLKSVTPPLKSQTPPPKIQTPPLKSQTPPLKSHAHSLKSETPPPGTQSPLKSHTPPLKTQCISQTSPTPLKLETPPTKFPAISVHSEVSNCPSQTPPISRPCLTDTQSYYSSPASSPSSSVVMQKSSPSPSAMQVPVLSPAMQLNLLSSASSYLPSQASKQVPSLQSSSISPSESTSSSTSETTSESPPESPTSPEHECSSEVVLDTKSSDSREVERISPSLPKGASHLTKDAYGVQLSQSQLAQEQLNELKQQKQTLQQQLHLQQEQMMQSYQQNPPTSKSKLIVTSAAASSPGIVPPITIRSIPKRRNADGVNLERSYQICQAVLQNSRYRDQFIPSGNMRFKAKYAMAAATTSVTTISASSTTSVPNSALPVGNLTATTSVSISDAISTPVLNSTTSSLICTSGNTSGPYSIITTIAGVANPVVNSTLTSVSSSVPSPEYISFPRSKSDVTYDNNRLSKTPTIFRSNGLRSATPVDIVTSTCVTPPTSLVTPTTIEEAIIVSAGTPVLALPTSSAVEQQPLMVLSTESQPGSSTSEQFIVLTSDMAFSDENMTPTTVVIATDEAGNVVGIEESESKCPLVAVSGFENDKLGPLVTLDYVSPCHTPTELNDQERLGTKSSEDSPAYASSVSSVTTCTSEEISMGSSASPLTICAPGKSPPLLVVHNIGLDLSQQPLQVMDLASPTVTSPGSSEEPGSPRRPSSAPVLVSNPLRKAAFTKVTRSASYQDFHIFGRSFAQSSPQNYCETVVEDIAELNEAVFHENDLCDKDMRAVLPSTTTTLLVTASDKIDELSQMTRQPPVTVSAVVTQVHMECDVTGKSQMFSVPTTQNQTRTSSLLPTGSILITQDPLQGHRGLTVTSQFPGFNFTTANGMVVTSSPSNGSPSVVATGGNGSNCACNLKAMVMCCKCGAFCHDDCIGPSKLCVTCLIR